MRLYNDTKYLEWWISKKELFLIIRSKEYKITDETIIINFPMSGFSGYRILCDGGWVSINSVIGKQISRYLKFIRAELKYDVFVIDFDKIKV